ncbi:hypothetical protein [Streptomyces sp. ISL-11]|uniref:hypothetical protein n=1 Tax=Streptomyces sp. ISL-11 TaxID=2819174 RepID=UPI001BE5660B|nr:hypothetical protein [Streptomyces sp. ISL-11]MBT2383304.1 hypothetical protein [Streptomyces sp. ISL-11]
MRSPILDSWQRSRALGLSPEGTELPYTDDLDLDGRLVRAAGPVLDPLQSVFAGRNMNVALADGRGAVLQRRFGTASMVRRLPPIQTVPGFVFAERFAGTNGIGLALAERQLINVFGAEHFAERGQANACSAIPVRDPLSGRIEGVLCLGYPHTDTDAALNLVIRKAAGAIERRMLEQSSARERGLLQAYLDTRAHVPAGGPAGDGQLGELAASGLDRQDRMILEEKATELISSAQRAAVEVSLPGGLRVTLLSRPVTSSSGVEGVAIEAVLASRPRRLAVSVGADAAPGLLGQQPFFPAARTSSRRRARCAPPSRRCRPHARHHRRCGRPAAAGGRARSGEVRRGGPAAPGAAVGGQHPHRHHPRREPYRLRTRRDGRSAPGRLRHHRPSRGGPARRRADRPPQGPAPRGGPRNRGGLSLLPRR